MTTKQKQRNKGENKIRKQEEEKNDSDRNERLNKRATAGRNT